MIPVNITACIVMPKSIYRFEKKLNYKIHPENRNFLMRISREKYKNNILFKK